VNYRETGIREAHDRNRNSPRWSLLRDVDRVRADNETGGIARRHRFLTATAKEERGARNNCGDNKEYDKRFSMHRLQHETPGARGLRIPLFQLKLFTQSKR
jgi:SET domain-containing protein